MMNYARYKPRRQANGMNQEATASFFDPRFDPQYYVWQSF